MKAFVIIPARNEERSLPFILRRLKSMQGLEVVVVDDGSTDRTDAVGRGAHVRIMRLKRSMGAGRATALGLGGISKGVTVLMDADGQHDPACIPLLLSEINNGVDYVIASRYIQAVPSVTSRIREMGTKLISLWIWIWYGKHIYDPTSGYRALSVKAVSYFSNQYPTFFSEPEAVLSALEQGMVIKEISCVMKPRLYGTSSISIVKAVTLMVYILGKIPTRAVLRVIRTLFSFGQR
jgi:glycosyltransferase involved in cell wall biosynthesis